MIKKVVVSGIQPTGKLHLGNYLGAIKQWKELQNNPEYDCKFFIADLHAMTTEKFDLVGSVSDDLIHNTIKDLQAFGIKDILLQRNLDLHPKYNLLRNFWMLCCSTSIGQLNRMTQFKEKADKGSENVGLYIYPILMAADILTLGADLVPVGADQKQHLELTRDLAKKLDLKIPEPLISKSCGRIMSLVDPTRKMSKSDPNDNSRINLSDSADKIFLKIKKATTTDEGCDNLTRIYLACGGEEGILNWNNSKHAKEVVAEQIIEELGK